MDIKNVLLLGHWGIIILGPFHGIALYMLLACQSQSCLGGKTPQQIGFAVGFAGVSLGRKSS